MTSEHPGSLVIQQTRMVWMESIVVCQLHYIYFIYTSRAKNAPPLGSHVFQANTNLLTKFHEDWTINVASRVLTRKNAPPPGGHVFTATETIFELIQDIIGTNLLTKFHEDRKINVASRVLTRKNAPLPRGHVFQPTGIIFQFVQDIIRINLLTQFHEDRTINVASRVLTRFYYSHLRKNALPLGSHTNLLTKFHEDWTLNVASMQQLCSAPARPKLKGAPPYPYQPPPCPSQAPPPCP
ncbi:hypothetical protein DPMN_023972 [Dreissena polymorpha]|uniref:Uncharacterized protein n=1 Tax=Dreissena polymorpha TaxID=45954 RepID=A0A9D4RCA0_DREPO|nr:hypothetical protein DPMN_023972 [Dreissena polymorpha]